MDGNGWIACSKRLPNITGKAPSDECLVVVERWIHNVAKPPQREMVDRWVQLASLRSDNIWIDEDGAMPCEDRIRGDFKRAYELRVVTHWQEKPALPERGR